MKGRVSDLYVDDNKYICIDHTIDRNFALTWVLHDFGWDVYLDETNVYNFDVEEYGVGFPTNYMFVVLEDMISHFTCTFGMWELSWMSEKEYCRKHLRFDEFEDALTAYQNLKLEGEI